MKLCFLIIIRVARGGFFSHQVLANSKKGCFILLLASFSRQTNEFCCLTGTKKMVNKTLTNCTTILKYDFKDLNLVISGLHIILGAVIIFFNIVVILVYSLAKPKFRQKAANMLLCNQAFVDLFQGKVLRNVNEFQCARISS